MSSVCHRSATDFASLSHSLKDTFTCDDGTTPLAVASSGEQDPRASPPPSAGDDGLTPLAVASPGEQDSRPPPSVPPPQLSATLPPPSAARGGAPAASVRRPRPVRGVKSRHSIRERGACCDVPSQRTHLSASWFMSLVTCTAFERN